MDKADQLAAIAVDLLVRVRDESPEDVHRWLAAVMDPADWMGLAIVLACAVPDDRSWKELTAWTWVRHLRPSRSLEPCGTVAAASRHRRQGEALCEDCKVADRQRKRDRRVVKSALSTTVGQPVDNGTDGCPQAVPRLSTDVVARELPSPYGSAA